MNVEETKALMRRFDIRPTRSLGQNFLIDDRVVSRICASVQIQPLDLIIEIGPGMGALTTALAASAGCVTAIEIDRHMLPVLEFVLSGYKNTSIIHQDACKVDFGRIASDWTHHVKVAANLPYYITTQLVQKLLMELPQATTMLLMMQREAAERLFAQPGNKEYGPVAVLAYLYGTCKTILTVPPSAYLPQPAVSSLVIQLTRHDHTQMSKEQEMSSSVRAWQAVSANQLQAFSKLLEACFRQRRKTLYNCLRQSGYLRDSNRLSRFLIGNGLPVDVRAEGLKPGHFLDLYFHLQERLP